MDNHTPTLKGTAKARFFALRQKVVNRVLSVLYGQPMQVMPAGHVGLAGSVVLWFMQDNFRHFVMLKSPHVGDGRARFPSCLGLGKHPDMPSALKAVLTQQTGPVFTKTLEQKLLQADRVGAVPLFSYTDDALGITTPVQALVWVQQIQAAQVELIVTPKDTHTVLVPEFAMSSNKISPTHKALYQAVLRSLPKLKMTAMPSAESVDEAIKEGLSASNKPRTIN